MAGPAGRCLLVCAVMVALCLLCGDAQLYVNVYNSSTQGLLSRGLQYEDDTIFSQRYLNLDEMRGYIHIPVPYNACSFIPPLPPGLNGSWFALVSHYPACPVEMVVNVQAAGYRLLIAYGSNDTMLSVPRSLSDSDFPIVIVPEWYAIRLKDNASYVMFPDTLPAVRVEVATSLGLSVFVVTFSLAVCCLCCCAACCGCYYCKSRRSERREEVQFREYRDRQRNFDQVQRRDRNARQELIESILRQLQDLQVDLRTQIPLGEAETQRLAILPYFPMENRTETCVICVEDFIKGESLRWLPCEHCFHPVCIDEWLGRHSSLCPLCKRPVPREGGVAGGGAVHIVITDSSDGSRLLNSDNSRYGAI